MNYPIVRLSTIHIVNFKNVIDGNIDLKTRDCMGKANLLGLYGQNGSGKTALVDALMLLKLALCGQTVPNCFSDYINTGESQAVLSFSFEMWSPDSDAITTVTYTVAIQKKELDSNTIPGLSASNQLNSTLLCNETLSYSVKTNGNVTVRSAKLIDTDSVETPFVSSSERKYHDLVGNSTQSLASLMAAKKISETLSKSFVFSKEFLDIFRANCRNDSYRLVIESLVLYGNRDLFVFDTPSNAIISFNILPISFNYAETPSNGFYGNLAIPFAGNGLIPVDALSLVEKIIENLNIVLNALIPGLTVSCEKMGIELLPNGDKAQRIQLLSNKNDKAIPFCYESEGIKKIVAILQLLIMAYNNPSATVVIDELDSGVFEYLLGEILRIISTSGKGQLIFTSHNLRPLETIDKSFIAFTTTNPQKRYIRIVNVKTTNNLRNFYYRDITLGEQAEPVYESTNNHDIAIAFKKAGECCGT